MTAPAIGRLRLSVILPLIVTAFDVSVAPVVWATAPTDVPGTAKSSASVAIEIGDRLLVRNFPILPGHAGTSSTSDIDDARSAASRRRETTPGVAASSAILRIGQQSLHVQSAKSPVGLRAVPARTSKAA